jgi:hypothetical protein
VQVQDAACRVEEVIEEQPREIVRGRGRNPNSLANLRPQRPGEPGRNPRGRPKKDFEVAAEAEKHAGLAIATLAEVCADTEAPPASRISAASELLDRAFGRAPQSIKMKTELTFSEQFEDFIRMVNAKTVHGTLATEGRRLEAIEPSVRDRVPASEA